jgi:hypothetical protein
MRTPEQARADVERERAKRAPIKTRALVPA